MANIVSAAGSGYGNPFIDSLIWGGGKWGAGPVTYWFASGAYTSDTTEPFPPSAFGASWEAAEIDAFETALQLYSNVANIQFQQAASYADADLAWWQFSESDLDGFLGLHHIPETPGATQPIDGFFSYTDEMWSDLTPGSLGFLVVVHELGHGLGLAHPHDGGSQPDWSLFPGVSDGRPGDLGTFSLNQGIWTTMSYNEGWNRVPAKGNTPSYGVQGTPMAFDIAALQELYGANMSYNTGDNTYLLPTANGSGTFWSCIWDAGGDEDTIDASGATGACKINLNDATLAPDDPNAGGFVSWVQGIVGGFTIANGVVIENAAGGSGRDTLTGNEFANELIGNAGNDSLDGGAGTDDMLGGLGDDKLSGGEGNDTLDGGAGRDGMAGGAGDDVYVVLETTDKVTESSAAGDDTVWSAVAYTLGKNLEDLELTAGDTKGTGNTLDNLMIGSGGNNTLDGKVGADTMRGGLGDDLYVVDLLDEVDETGGGGKDTILIAASFNLGAPIIAISGVIENLTLAGKGAIDGTGATGGNTITGNSGTNVLDGKAGNDSLAGGAGNDSLVGDVGNDTLDGGTGDDTMTGGADDDTYVVNSTKDVVQETGSGIDTIQATIAIDLTLAPYDGIEHVTLTGTSGLKAIGDDEDNQLVGNDGANLLIGGIGLDTLIGGAGNDTLDGDTGADDADSLAGGPGNDTYLIDKLGDKVTEAGNEGTDTVRTAVSGYTLTPDVENLVLLAGAGAASATGNELKNTLTGNDAANTLDGKAGADTMTGGKGDDTYFVDDAKDAAKESSGMDSGADTAHSTAAAFTLSAYVENLVLDGAGNIAGTGNTLNNIITGNDGDNTLNGGGGADTVNAGLGDDTYIIDTKDAVADDGGIDIVQASFSVDLTAAFDGIEGVTLTGSGGLFATGDEFANRLIGNGGANKLTGNGAADTIEGAAGNDTIDGGTGDDRITGGKGTDRIDLAAGNDTVFYTSKLDGKDIIDNFDGAGGAGAQDILNLDLLFDSLGVADGDRAARVSVVANATGGMDVKVNTDANATFELTVATLDTADPIAVGTDIIVSQP